MKFFIAIMALSIGSTQAFSMGGERPNPGEPPIEKRKIKSENILGVSGDCRATFGGMVWSTNLEIEACLRGKKWLVDSNGKVPGSEASFTERAVATKTYYGRSTFEAESACLEAARDFLYHSNPNDPCESLPPKGD